MKTKTKVNQIVDAVRVKCTANANTVLILNKRHFQTAFVINSNFPSNLPVFFPQRKMCFQLSRLPVCHLKVNYIEFKTERSREYQKCILNCPLLA